MPFFVTAQVLVRLDGVGSTIVADTLIAAPSTELAGTFTSVTTGGTSATCTVTGVADTAAGFTYTINWGDGSAAQVVAPGGSPNPGHVYKTLGNFKVSVTATDKDGGVSTAAAQTIAITPIALEGTTLAIGGLTADDLIFITQNNAGGSKNLYVSDDLLLNYKLKEALFTRVDVYQRDDDGVFVAQNVSDAVYLVDANGNIMQTLHAAKP